MQPKLAQSCEHSKQIIFRLVGVFAFPLMSIDQQHPIQTGKRILACWKAVQQGYRALNELTHHALGFLFKAAVVLYFLFATAFLGLRYFVLPHIDNYKSDVEAIATRTIGSKVAIKEIGASWDSLRPQLTLDDVVIHDKAGNEALRLPKVSATVSWLSVVVGEVRLHRLEIDRPEMDITRDAQGNLTIGGIFIDMKKSADSRIADWALTQSEIAIRDGKLRWKDDLRVGPLLPLDNVNIVLRNHWRHHQFALTAAPPAELAAPLDLRADFVHPHFTRQMSNPMLWKGELYVDLRNTDLAVWKAYVDYPVELAQGQGSVRAWLNFDHAKVANFTADLSLANVSARLRKDLAPLNLVQVNGRVSVREDFNPGSEDGTPTFGINGHAIALMDFSLQTDDGLQLPSTTISESHTPARFGRPEQTSLSARYLDLKTVVEFAERLPLTAEQHQILADFAPRGVLKDFSMQWQGAYPQIASYKVKGGFEGLSLNPQAPRPAVPKSGKTPAQAAIPGIPGFDNLSGTVEASDKGGRFDIASEKLKLQFPGYFAEPEIPLDRLQMQAKWDFQGKDKLSLDVSDFSFAQGGLSGSFNGKHVMSMSRGQNKSPGVIDISGTLTGLDLDKVETYLPTGLPEDARAWLDGALVGGTAEDMRIKLKGDLADFPFQPRKAGEKARGEFLVQGKIKDGVLNYTPGHFAKDGKAPMWPLLEAINGTIVFDRARMEVRADSAKTHGTAVSDVKAVIEDLSLHNALLEISGEATGNLDDMVGYVNNSPVAELIGQVTDETRASGNAKLGLKLELPLAQLDASKVNGMLQFANNSVTLLNNMPPLQATSGKFEFSEKGFNLNGIKAIFVGGPVTLAGGMSKDGAIQVKADGMLTAIGLRRAYPAPAMQKLIDRVSGSARYAATVRVKNRHPDVLVESNLAGLGIDLPVPLRKSANDTTPLRFELLGLPSSDATIQRDEMKLAFGPAVAVRYERQKTEKDAEWRVLRGGIGVNVPAPVPDSGLSANLNMKSLDIDEWSNITSSLLAGPQGSADDADTPTAPDSVGQYFEPDVVTMRAGEVTVFDKKIANIVVGASHQKSVWQANVISDHVSGHVTWNQSRFGRSLGRVTARLATLIIPKSDVANVSDLLDSKSETTQIPALDIVAENFELFDKKFGRLELTANNARGASGREWRISKLQITNQDAEFKATGKWAKADSGSVSDLAYNLNIVDAGKLLERFGFAGVLRGGKGKMEGDLNWKGLPFSLDIPTLSGNLQMELASGQFLKVDPNAAKLLGVLNMQALPRRLVLDFRDVFSEGFAFDGISGAVAINNGMAKTDSLKMRGVAATVLIDGTADVAHESQNLHVSVIPEINVGAASVVYGLAVNPVIGVGTLLAQMFLRDPLMKAFTFEYQVSGPWKDPVVTKLARKNAVEPATAESAKPG
jgi:uncharacterized protein (TIGR02099 family)